MINAYRPIKKSKYGNVKCSAYGHDFDSEAEREYYFHLRFRQQRGEIRNLQVHPKWVLSDSVKVPEEKTGRKPQTLQQVTYSADFEFDDLTLMRHRVIDVKGFRTEAFKIKKKWMYDKYGIWVEEVKLNELSKV